MRTVRTLALCIAILLALSSAAYASKGIDVKASVLFGTRLSVDDVGNVGAEGTGTMEWVDVEGEYDLETTGTAGADKVGVSPEETGYPVLVEASYPLGKVQIGGFWLGGFASKGEASGEVKGFDETTYRSFEQFVFHPVFSAMGTSAPLETLESLSELDAMMFFGGENVPVLPGMVYYFGHYSKEPTVGSERDGLYVLAADDVTDARYTRASAHGGIGQAEHSVDPDEGATKWASEVSFNLANYGGNVGYRLFDGNNISVTAMVGLEQLKWQEAVKNTAKESYDINFTTMDVEYAVDGGEYYDNLVNQLYGDEFDLAAHLKEAPDLGEETVDATLDRFSLRQASKLEAARDIQVVRRLDYNPIGYSIGVSAGGLVVDKLRVSANFSLGWFSGDANVKINTKDNRTSKFTPLAREGTGTWTYSIDGDDGERTVEIPIKDDSGVWVSTEPYETLAEEIDGRGSETTTEKNHPDTKVSMMKAQASIEYDLTDWVFLGGGFFYSLWKDMPVLSDTDAFSITIQDLTASGVNIEVGIRF